MRTLIIGGGLSGLALADMLQAQGQDYELVEARNRFGGRIKSEVYGAGAFDLGPAWFWPGQPRIAALIERLGLEKFDQFADGLQTVEDARGRVQHGRGYAAMQGSWRLRGGLGLLTETLAKRLPDDRKRLNAAVTSLAYDADRIRATLSTGEILVADRVVLALPPRIAAQIVFTPALPRAATQTMRGIATWMAGQAKAVAVYDQPFWRDAGLSGDVMSRAGPMVEIHDASPSVGGPYALFGFIGVPPVQRQSEQVLRQQVIAQLSRLFGPDAAAPARLYIKDWAFDPHTSTDADKAPLYAHPAYGMPPALTHLWEGHLHCAGTEVAAQFGGFIEGALEAAEAAMQALDVASGVGEDVS